MLPYFESNKFFSNCQYDFKAKRSTVQWRQRCPLRLDVLRGRRLTLVLVVECRTLQKIFTLLLIKSCWKSWLTIVFLILVLLSWNLILVDVTFLFLWMVVYHHLGWWRLGYSGLCAGAFAFHHINMLMTYQQYHGGPVEANLCAKDLALSVFENSDFNFCIPCHFCNRCTEVPMW